MTDWRPIETAPKDGTRVLLWWCGHWCIGRYMQDPEDGGCWMIDDKPLTPNTIDPTHWAPVTPPGENHD